MLLILAAGIGLAVYFLLGDDQPPSVTLSPFAGFVSKNTTFEVSVRDQESGLKNLVVEAVQNNRAVTLLNEKFAKDEYKKYYAFTLENTGFTDGPVDIRVTSVDASWAHWGDGNQAQTTSSFTLDTVPPGIEVLSNKHNLNQGGSGLIVYRVNEGVDRSGVAVGDYFFPGYRQENGVYLCFFAFPQNIEPGRAEMYITATDPAGNQRKTSFYNHVNPRSFREDTVAVTDSFLEEQMPQFQHYYPEETGLLDLFLKVNGDLRKKNQQDLYTIGLETSPNVLWEDAFLRQPNSARKGAFGDRRTYTYNGLVVDHQTHLGIDLASTAHAPIPAANSGKVIFTGDLGIYGQVILLDHGLGLQSMYAHTSLVKVKPGDRVQKGQIIGNTDATGLAVGDHLHFAMYVSGVAVNPVEWWDQTWIANNISDRLFLAGQ